MTRMRRRHVVTAVVAACGVTAAANVAARALDLPLPLGAGSHAASRCNPPSTWHPDLRLHVRVRSQMIVPGETAKYKVSVHRGPRLVRQYKRCGHGARPAAKVALTAKAPDGSGLRVTMWPRATRSPSATLTVRTTSRTPLGASRIRLTGKVTLVRTLHGRRVVRAKTSTTIAIIEPGPEPIVPGGSGPPTPVPVPTPTPPPTPTPTPTPPGSQTAPFGITGVITGTLSPGAAGRVDLQLSNPETTPLTITGLTARIDAVTAPRASVAYPCTLDDFSVVQYSGDYGFVVPPQATRSLSELGLAQVTWPQIVMIDRPVDQAGCQGSSLTLGFSGTSLGGTP